MDSVFTIAARWLERRAEIQRHHAPPQVRPGPALGDKTEFGTVVAVGIKDGERFYFAIDRHGCVSLMPVYEGES